MTKPSEQETVNENSNRAAQDSPARGRKLLQRIIKVIAAGLALLLVLDVGLVLLNSSGAQGSSAPLAQMTNTAVITPTIALTPTPVVADSQSATHAIRSTSTPQTSSPTVSKPTPPTRPLQAKQAATPSLCTDTAGTIVTETIQSKILSTDLPVQIYLPPCYDKSQYMYPTLYLIQGTAFYIGEWIEDGVTRVADLQINLGILPPFLIVMPASDLNRGAIGKYEYSTGGPGSWEDFMLSELIPLIETEYGAWPHREGRAIGGMSRGAYWSLQMAFANPDKFGIVGAHSPSITSAQLIGVSANFSMLNFVKSIDTLKDTRIWIDAGDTDWAQIGATQLSGELDAQGIAHEFSIGQGSHLDEYWASRVTDYLIWYASSWPKGIAANTAAGATRTQP